MAVDIKSLNHNQLNELINKAQVRQTELRKEKVVKLREKIHDEQWQHEATLKQIASPLWNPDERATQFVKRWQSDNAASLKQLIAEGGAQTARMLALDLDQQQPQRADDAKRDWSTVYRDDVRTIQDAPDGAAEGFEFGAPEKAVIGRQSALFGQIGTSGQNHGITKLATIQSSRFSGMPTFMKSVKR